MVFSQKLSFLFSELKPRRGDSASLMQVGAFMQVMDEDARMVSGVIGLKLQMAGDVDSPVVIRAAILIVDKLPAILVLGKMAMRERLPSREKSWQDATHTGWLLQVRFIMRDLPVIGGFPLAGRDGYLGSPVRAGRSATTAHRDENKEFSREAFIMNMGSEVQGSRLGKQKQTDFNRKRRSQ